MDDREKFLDLLGAANLIPGPNSTEMAIQWARSSGLGGTAVRGPVLYPACDDNRDGCAWAYVRYGALPQAEWNALRRQARHHRHRDSSIWGLTRHGHEILIGWPRWVMRSSGGQFRRHQ